MRFGHVQKTVALAAVLLLAVPFSTRRSAEEEQHDDIHLECVIALPPRSSKVINYPVGYNYELLRIFAREKGYEVEVTLAKDGENFVDSVRNSQVSILVLPSADSLAEGYLCSREMPDGSVWALPPSSQALLKEINAWLHSHTTDKECKLLMERFRPAYDPYRRVQRGGPYKYASPYDRLFKEYSVEIGWDWRMLAALVWKESAFRIEATSPRGAEGLMQMMPHTARAHSNEDMVDPEKNISAAVEYIARLSNIFKAYAADNTELTKIILAAYNAGEGRIMDCIRLAKSKEMPYSTWAEIEAVIPLMREDSVLEEEAVKLGRFQGYETIRYVHEMTGLYSAFRAIVP